MFLTSSSSVMRRPVSASSALNSRSNSPDGEEPPRMLRSFTGVRISCIIRSRPRAARQRPGNGVQAGSRMNDSMARVLRLEEYS